MRKSVLLLIVLCMVALPAAAQQTQPDTAVPLVVAPELFDQAAQAAQAENYGRALLDFSLYILLNPTDSQGFYGRGRTYGVVGAFEDALSDFDRALRLAPNVPEYTAQVHFDRANIYLQQNNVVAALADLNMTLELAPANGDALLTRGNILAFQQRFDAALVDYNSAVDLLPNDNRPYGQRGALNLQLGNFDDALADLSRAIELNPQGVQPYVNRALLHSSQSNYRAALDDLDSALAISPENNRLYLFRASVRQSADQVRAAASDYLLWIDSINTRQITPDTRLVFNQPVEIDMAEGWLYNLPFEAEAGQVVSIAARQLPFSSADPLVVLVNAQRQALIGDDDGGGDLNAAISRFTIPADGEYTLIVGHALGGAEGRIGVIVGLDQ